MRVGESVSESESVNENDRNITAQNRPGGTHDVLHAARCLTLPVRQKWMDHTTALYPVARGWPFKSSNMFPFFKRFPSASG